jgi:hypothetical protein
LKKERKKDMQCKLSQSVVERAVQDGTANKEDLLLNLVHIKAHVNVGKVTIGYIEGKARTPCKLTHEERGGKLEIEMGLFLADDIHQCPGRTGIECNGGRLFCEKSG